MDKNKLILPIAIVVGCLILGGFFFGMKVVEQNAITERQQSEELAKTISDLKAKTEAEQKQAELDFCLNKADSDYWSYMNINGTTKDDGTVWANNSIWDRAARDKQTAVDNCLKLYK